MNLRKLLVTATLMALPVTGFAEKEVTVTAFFPQPLEDAKGNKLKEGDITGFRMLCSDKLAMARMERELAKPVRRVRMFSDEAVAPVIYARSASGHNLMPPILIRNHDTFFDISRVKPVPADLVPSFVEVPEGTVTMLRTQASIKIYDNTDIVCAMTYIDKQNRSSHIYYKVNLPPGLHTEKKPSTPSMLAVK